MQRIKTRRGSYCVDLTSMTEIFGSTTGVKGGRRERCRAWQKNTHVEEMLQCARSR
jgi:hypothetical protein